MFIFILNLIRNFKYMWFSRAVSNYGRSRRHPVLQCWGENPKCPSISEGHSENGWQTPLKKPYFFFPQDYQFSNCLILPCRRDVRNCFGQHITLSSLRLCHNKWNACFVYSASYSSLCDGVVTSCQCHAADTHIAILQPLSFSSSLAEPSTCLSSWPASLSQNNSVWLSK